MIQINIDYYIASIYLEVHTIIRPFIHVLNISAQFCDLIVHVVGSTQHFYFDNIFVIIDACTYCNMEIIIDHVIILSDIAYWFVEKYIFLHNIGVLLSFLHYCFLVMMGNNMVIVHLVLVLFSIMNNLLEIVHTIRKAIVVLYISWGNKLILQVIHNILCILLIMSITYNTLSYILTLEFLKFLHLVYC